MNFNQRQGFAGRPSMMPQVIKALLIINISVYVFEMIFASPGISTLIRKYLALLPFQYSLFTDGGFWPWQLITYQFLHGDFWHLALNMFALWMFGTELENIWGSRRFLYYYLLAGIGAGLIHLVISPLFSTPLPAVGASGSIYGLLIAFGMTFPNRPIFMFPFFIPIPAKFFVLIFGVIELFSGLTGGSGIAHFAHLGGALTGFLLLRYGDKLGIYEFFDKLFSNSKKSENNYEYSYEKPKVIKFKDSEKKPQSNSAGIYQDRYRVNVDGEEITQATIDDILDKISAAGYENLTAKEKKILFELSQKLK